MDTPEQVTQPEAALYALSLEEFCTELSSRDRRPEMVYAFSQDEKRNGRLRDMPDAYQDRFRAFVGREVAPNPAPVRIQRPVRKFR